MNKTQQLQTCLPSRCVEPLISAWKKIAICYLAGSEMTGSSASQMSRFSFFVCVFTGFVRDYDNGPVITNPLIATGRLIFHGNTSATKLQCTAL